MAPLEHPGIRTVRRVAMALLIVLVAAVPAGLAGATGGGSAPPEPVPPQYQGLYDTVAANLAAYETTLASTVRAGRTRAPVPGAELLSANGNRLEQLLLPATMTTVDQELAALHDVGIRGVTLGIKLPLLLPEYTPDASRYTDFFATVAEKARAAGMVVDVELGAAFCGTVFATCAYPWPATIDELASITATQAQTVIDRVRPKYLTVLAEPTTQASLTGLGDFATPEGAAQYVRGVLAGITDRRRTEVGAGAASWLPMTFDELLVQEDLDYLVTHIYPATARIAQNLVDTAALARTHHLPLVVDELWLYKTDGSAVAKDVAQSEQTFRLDRFGFFAPLDERFFTATRAWARRAGVVYASAFWSGQLLATLTWTPELDALGYRQLTQAANRAFLAAMASGARTDAGRAWTH